MVLTKTHKASCKDLSASSNKWEEDPLKTIEQAWPYLQPENLINLLSPIIISSILATYPKTSSALSGVSNVDKISDPKDRDSLSTPSKSACSITVTPFSAKSCSG